MSSASVRLPDEQNQRHYDNKDSFSGLISGKHRILLHQFLKGSSLQKKLIILIFFAGVGFSLTLCLFIFYFGLKHTQWYCSTCTKPECIIAATRLLEGMNQSVDPCENFYEFVCGNWNQSQHLNSDDTNSWFLERAAFVDNQLKDILEENESSQDLKPVAQMKEFYRMCLDTRSLNTKGMQPIYDLLDILELPRALPQPATIHNFDLAKVLAHIQRLLSVDIMIQLSTQFNSTLNTTFLIISPVDREEISVQAEKMLSNKYTITYSELLVRKIKYMTAVIQDFSPGLSKDDITRESLKIFLFGAELKLKGETADFELEYMTLNDLQSNMFPNNSNLYSPFHWGTYISTLTDGINISLQMNDTVVVVNPLYFQSLGVNLFNINVVNFQRYVWWKIIEFLAVHATDKIRNHKLIFFEELFKGKVKYSRRGECTSLVKRTFPEVIAHIFAKRKDISNVSNNIEEMMTKMKKTLRKTIINSEWLDSETKEVNLKKLDTVKLNIGYSKIFHNTSWLEEEYNQAENIPTDFIGSLINVRSTQVPKILSTVNTSKSFDLEFSRWHLDPTEINAFNRRDFNAITIPFGMLQFPFYSDGIEALNYGAIGAILAHELMHGFDNEGKRFDWQGNLRETWNENMTLSFDKNALCFVKQYEKYHISENVTVNGTLTLTENIADNGGIKEAFYAYEDYVADKGVEPLLPAFERFSHQQLLFLSYANMWCVNYGEYYKKVLHLDSHSPHQYRVNGVVSNFPEFAKTWNCKVDSPMNPSNKCSLW